MADTKVVAPMVGKIVSIDAPVGSPIEKNQRVITLEAMKMKIGVVAPVSGTVKEINVSPGQTVDSGTVIALIAEGA